VKQRIVQRGGFVQLLLLLAPTGLLGQDPGAPPVDQTTIEVTGSGYVSVPVDQARVVFAVQTRAEDAQSAVAANAELMEAVIEAVRATDLPDLEIETTGFNLQPFYARPAPGSDEARVESFQAVNNLSVTMSDVEATGTLLDVAVMAGANRIASLSFSARNTETARMQALAEAVGAARREAEVIADALGRPLGEPIEVRGGAQRTVPMARAMSMEFQASATPVEAGDQTVSASVTIRYRLQGRSPR
jgi:uncharacterized protein YggE